jgi:hypothetical protein
MMNTRTKIVVASAALILLAVGLIARSSEHPGPAAIRPGTAAREGGRRGPCAFERDDRLAYALSIQANAVVHGERMGAAGSTAVARNIEARLALEALSADANGAILLARFSPIRVDGAEAALDAPFLLRVRGCQVEGFARHTSTGSADARTVQGLAHELGFANVAPGEARTLESDDAAGHYRATFNSAAERSISRHIDAYTALWDGSAAPGTLIRPTESASTIALDGGRWFASIERHEVLTGVAAADTDQTLSVRRAEVDTEALARADRDTSHYVWENLLPRVTFRRAKREVTRRDLEARKAVQSATLEETLADFVVRSREVANFAETWPPLSTYLEARPEMTRPLAHALRTGIVPPEGRAGGWLAIGAARTEEARTVLLDVMRDPSALAINRTRAMFALLDRDDVGAELTRELGAQALAVTAADDKEARFFVHESALAMGMMAGIRGETEPEVAQVALALVPQLLRAKATAGELHPVFGAIANIGHASTLALVKPYTLSADAKIREGAALAVRRLSPLASNDFVAEWLAREQDAGVKRELYVTLSKQSHDARLPAGNAVLDHAIQDLAEKPGVIARRAIIKLLGEAVSAYPPARAALIAQSRVEAVERTGLYTVIAQYLGADDLSTGLAQGSVNP